jgi:hypothetical protein
MIHADLTPGTRVVVLGVLGGFSKYRGVIIEMPTDIFPQRHYAVVMDGERAQGVSERDAVVTFYAHELAVEK